MLHLYEVVALLADLWSPADNVHGKRGADAAPTERVVRRRDRRAARGRYCTHLRDLPGGCQECDSAAIGAQDRIASTDISWHDGQGLQRERARTIPNRQVQPAAV